MLDLTDIIARASQGLITLAEVDSWPAEERMRLAEETVKLKRQLRQERALALYEPVSEEAVKFHCSKALQRVIVGGNGSSKSETNFVDLAIEMTGIIPDSLKTVYPKEKLRPPIHARLIVRGFTTTSQQLLDKFIWNKWTGLSDGVTGHWGWIPREMLLNGRWEDSWSAQFKTLTILNGSTLQIMTHEQPAEHHASSSMHRTAVDEGPTSDIWRENLFRLREGGSISLAMTPPDDESQSWSAAWVHRDLYEKGLAGPHKDPNVESFTFFTEKNRFISREQVAKITAGLTPAQYETRMHGRFFHLGGRVYPTYTDRPQMWCFKCNAISLAKRCAKCQGEDTVEFCHLVEPFSEAYKWPAIMIVDPHPRKKHAFSWFTVSPSDDIFQVAELETGSEIEEVAKEVQDLETNLRLDVLMRGMDPNMGESPVSVTSKKGRNVRHEFDAVGLRCRMMDDDQFTARNTIRTYLKPDPRTRQPRFRVFTTCPRTNYMFLNWLWDERATRASIEKHDIKEKTQDKDSDFPKNVGYFLNDNPTYATYHNAGVRRIKHPARRRTA